MNPGATYIAQQHRTILEHHHPPSNVRVEMASSITTTQQRQEAHGTEKRPQKRSRPSKEQGDNNNDDCSSWTEQVHWHFCRAIHELGVKHASPSILLANMTLKHDSLTQERLKSHLQKYRKYSDKSVKEFLMTYELWLQQALTMGAADTAGSLTAMPVNEMMGLDYMLGGHVPAYLTYAVMTSDTACGSAETEDTIATEFPLQVDGSRIPIPVLTDEELKSPLGASISRTVALCQSMTQFILQQRGAANEQERPAQDRRQRPRSQSIDSIGTIVDIDDSVYDAVSTSLVDDASGMPQEEGQSQHTCSDETQLALLDTFEVPMPS